MAKNDTALMMEIRHSFELQVINNWEEIKESVIVDQIPFGVTAIYLYQFFGDEKFKIIADDLYEKTKLLVSTEHDIPLIFYRKNQSKKSYIVDTLGMICPFLIRYGITFNENNAINLAYDQLNYYTTYGLDCSSFLPSHAIQQKNNIKIGPHNWGRGIGWYFFPMSEFYKYVDNEVFSIELTGLMESLNIFKTDEGVWNQFLGTSEKFDASPTVMYMYGFNNIKPETFTREVILNKLKPHIYNGIIGPTSGGAFAINNYSRTFGQSELTQGIFLLLLSTVVEPN
jgi:unsaturated rhamnogalacturonyl hydrolase